MFEHSDDDSLVVAVLKRRLQRLGHVLRMSSPRITHRALFADFGTDCKKQRGVQFITWCCGMKESCTRLASVGPSRISSLGPSVRTTYWLEALSDMAQN